MRFQKSASVRNLARMHTLFLYDNFARRTPDTVGNPVFFRSRPSAAKILRRKYFSGRDRLLTDKRPVNGKIRENKR